MRIFINNVDSYVGKALSADLREVAGQKNRIFGTFTKADADVDTAVLENLGVTRVVSRSDKKKYLADVLSCTLIVYDLHSAVIEDVEMILKHLKLASLERDTVFVLISSVKVWAKTLARAQDARVPLNDEEDEEEEEDEDDETKPKQPKPTKPRTLTDADLDRRLPTLACEPWKYVETLALALNSKDKLRTHVLWSGVLYGNEELTFNEMFKAAWLSQETHHLLHPGSNFIPCIHVRDVARLVRIVAADDQVGPHLIAVDNSTLTQMEIVQGIVDQMSHKWKVPVKDTLATQSEFKDEMTLDLIMEPSRPLQKNFDWWCKGGLRENISQVAEEFCKWRNLRPIKMVVLGPPGSGAERVCSRVAKNYLHSDTQHLTFDSIVNEAMQKGSRFMSAKKLRRLVAKIAKKPGKKLPAEIRTKLVRERLLSNVCRCRGFVLEGYPETYEDAEALFMEKVPVEGEEQEEEAEEQEEEEEGGDEGEEVDDEDETETGDGKPQDQEDEDEGEEEEDDKPKFQLNASVIPEYVVVLDSVQERCKDRIFRGEAQGASNEQEFNRKTQEYMAANQTQDERPCTSDFFGDIAGTKVLRINMDKSSDEETFQAIRVYLESKGYFDNYLRSEEDIAREKAEQIAKREQQADEEMEEQRKVYQEGESKKREQRQKSEAGRRQAIAEAAASDLEQQAHPLRQYLMLNVVPTLTEGLSEVCQKMPDDPIEYLAQYLFAHANDTASQGFAAESG